MCSQPIHRPHDHVSCVSCVYVCFHLNAPTPVTTPDTDAARHSCRHRHKQATRVKGRDWARKHNITNWSLLVLPLPLRLRAVSAASAWCSFASRQHTARAHKTDGRRMTTLHGHIANTQHINIHAQFNQVVKRCGASTEIYCDVS